MNTFFPHREVYKYTWDRPSINQKSLIDFCIFIVESYLFSEAQDIRVKRGAELQTDHHLVVWSLRLSKPCWKVLQDHGGDGQLLRGKHQSPCFYKKEHIFTHSTLAKKNHRVAIKKSQNASKRISQQPLNPHGKAVMKKEGE